MFTLYDACKDGDLKGVKDLLSSDAALVNITTNNWPYNGKTPLHVASSHGHVEIVRELLNRGARIEAGDLTGLTPLNKACCFGFLDVVKELLDRHANIETVDKINKNTPLHSACCYDYHEIARELLDRGANLEAIGMYKRTPLLNAIGNSSMLTVPLLLSRGASINAVESGGDTALHLACTVRRTAFVEELLDRGADVNARSGNLKTPLIAATCNGGSVELVFALLARGASVNLTDRDGHLPLHFSNNISVLEALLDAGTDIDSRCNSGETALELACGTGDRCKVEFLLSRGASYSSIDDLIAKANSPIQYRSRVEGPGSPNELIEFLEGFSASTYYILK